MHHRKAEPAENGIGKAARGVIPGLFFNWSRMTGQNRCCVAFSLPLPGARAYNIHRISTTLFGFRAYDDSV